MRKFLGVAGVALTALLVTATPAAARDFSCNGVFTGASYDNVIVPRGGACTLIDSAVAGEVKALKGAYFQATGTTVRGDIFGREAQTIFVDTRSRVAGSVEARKTAQVFIFNSRVTRDIDVENTSKVVQICGTTVLTGDIEVERSGRDILIGDPRAVGCAGNTVKRGDLAVKRSFANIEFVIRGNEIRKGDLKVLNNAGPVRKFVEDNTGGKRLRCAENSRVFRASDNARWDHRRGQCA